jgi:hypothetical protein
MIDTNALLSVGFSLVAAFADVVKIPDGIPTKAEDLQKYVVSGPPPIPATDLYLVDRRRRQFWIHDGAVYSFSSPGSFKELQNPQALPKFQGTPTLGSNDVLELATTTVRHLAKQGNPIAGIQPKVIRPGNGSDPIPFYWIRWPNTNQATFGLAPPDVAFIEIDAREGLITFLDLRAKGFHDYGLAAQISNRVHAPDPQPQGPSRWELQHRSPLKRVQSWSSTNEVIRAIGNWLALCQKLGVDPGSQTNVASVDWSRTFSYTNNELSRTIPTCQIVFSNGVIFESISGIAFSHFASDSCFSGSWEYMSVQERQRFKGKILKDWEGLAKDLERVLVHNVGIPKQLMTAYSAGQEIGRPKKGEETIARTVLAWRNWPRNAHRFVAVEETTLALQAEFDLETGELKWISFHDPHFIGSLRLAQSKGR